MHSIFSEYDAPDESSQRVQIDMRFSLEPSRFRLFKQIITAVNEKDYSRSAEEMKDSNGYRQVGKRAETLAKMMEAGG